MTHRTFDEQIANFNRVVSSWDINQEYKVALLGMIASLGYEHEKSITPEPHWIPVEQDLPKENYLDDGYVEPSQPVLVYMNYHAYKISRYWGHRKSKGTSDYVIPDWMDLEEYDGDNVIAWMPLPEPYKGVTI